jgi:hypothetical protein
MRKIYKISLVLVVQMILVSSCRDFVDPNIPYSDFDNGSYLRTISAASASSVAPTTNFNFFALNDAKFEATFEVVDNQLGGTVDNVTFSVQHLRIGATGQILTPAQPRLVKTLAASDFTSNSESKFPRSTVTITAAEAAAAVGLTFDQLDGGDFFQFSAELTTKEGRVFNADNASADVRGGFFYSSPFFYRLPVVCPSELARTYAFSTTNIAAGAGGNAGACGPTKTGSVTLTSVSTGAYSISDASFGVFDCAWADTPPGGAVRFRDACGRLSMTGADKYGDSYSMTFISNSGTALVFDWVNTYGDSGRTTLTAPSGFTFPNNLK